MAAQVAENNNIQAKLGDLSITSVEDVGGKKGFVEDEGEQFLFDTGLITALDVKVKNGRTPANPGEGLRMRPLGSGDFQRGFLECLAELTKVGDVSKEEFMKRFYAMKSRPGTYYVTVLEDVNTGKIVGAATLVVELKFIHCCNQRGVIEDVIVTPDYQGQKLGQLLMLTLTQLAISLGCYKVTLNCSDKMVGYYSSMGFKKEEGNANFLMLRVPNKS